IPTIAAYKEDQLIACGAEARDYLGDEENEVSRWFKWLLTSLRLHLHPESMKIADEPLTLENDNDKPPRMEILSLPTNVSLMTVYSDFMRYLFEGFCEFFEESTPNEPPFGPVSPQAW
ncbi:hypothetical protein FRC17_001231, partial [Serendipita sp. 399]